MNELKDSNAKKFVNSVKEQYEEWEHKGGCEKMIVESVVCGAQKRMREHACEEAWEQLPDMTSENKSTEDMKDLKAEVHRLTNGIPEILYTCLNLAKILKTIGVKDLSEMKQVMDIIKPSLVNEDVGHKD